MSNVAFFHDRLQLRSRGRILLIFICFKRIPVSITVQITPRGRAGALCGRTRLWFGLLSCQYLFSPFSRKNSSLDSLLKRTGNVSEICGLLATGVWQYRALIHFRLSFQNRFGGEPRAEKKKYV